MNKISEWLVELLMGGISWCIESFIAAFNSSLTILVEKVGMLPTDFDVTSVIKGISDTVIVPIAGIMLTYIFAKNIIDLLLEKNNMVEFELFNLYKVIFQMFLAILLVTNCWNITMAFFDIGGYLVNKAIGIVSVTELGLEPAVMIASIEESLGNNAGQALIVLLVSFVALIAGWIATAIILIVAYSRVITILVYISVAPIAFSTLMNKDWVGAIGQNYLKNLMALALQGFLMLIVMIIYGGLVSEIISTSSDPVQLILFALICMFVCGQSLMRCLSLAKSIVNAN